MLLHATSLTWVGSLLWSIEATSGVDRVTKGTLEKTGSSDDEVERLRERLRGIFDRGLKQYWPPGTGGTIDDLKQRIIEQLERMKAECPDAIRDLCISSINEFIRAIRSGWEIGICLTDQCRLVNRIIRLLRFLERNFALLDLNQDGKISYGEFVDYILRILIRQDPSAKPTQQELDLLKIIRELLEYYFKCGGT
jgi:hypothetical protein